MLERRTGLCRKEGERKGKRARKSFGMLAGDG